ncbi:MAG: endolytic transglycosylase MltG [Chitinophagaceae bacterium]|nr:endolytic transglycosylase MltG [Chitinophagaceae bacterium]
MKKTISLFAVGISLILLILSWFYLWRSNTVVPNEKAYLYIRTGATYSDVLDSLTKHQYIRHLGSFKTVASLMKLEQNIHAGRYEIVSGMGNYSIVRMLKSGRQKPVKLVINKLRTKTDIVRKLDAALEPDSTSFAQLLNDTAFLKTWNLNTSQVQCLFVPATYECYWNTTAEKAISKIAEAYTRYWNDERKQLAASIGLSIPQVITIASIVEEETNQDDEKARIASVYLNRYKLGMMLGADPTVKFAVGDFTLRRILNKHTQFASPYNTYQVKGLPPGPICTPGKASIDAVLHAEKTNFLFFCAKEDFTGHHNFAVTYDEHLQNARRYQAALDARKIK